MLKPKVKRELSLNASPLKIYTKILVAALSDNAVPDKAILLGHIRARNFDALLKYAEQVSPTKYGSAALYFAAAQFAALVKKYPFTPNEVPGINPLDVALGKFRRSERRCGRINLKRTLKRKRFDKYAQIMSYARSYIEGCIGSKPDLLSIYDKCGFAAGASLGVHGNKTNAGRKLLASDWSCTPSALPYATASIWRNPIARDMLLHGDIKCYDYAHFEQAVKDRTRLVRYNKISFVTKTARSHRQIAIEPTLNGWIQKGIDNEMREKLRRFGIDLQDQQLNQEMARLGSLGGFNPYVTMDLKDASNSLAIEVVHDLLPYDWYRLLSDTRSAQYVNEQRELHSFSMFCSMGNGFCFPLQTLVFASIAFAVNRVCGESPKDFSVYGDDIIVRQSTALLLKEVLMDLGFKLNDEKSFILGPFRESCGSDWYAGRDVRPATLKKSIETSIDAHAFHNTTLRSPFTEIYFGEVRRVLRASVLKLYLKPGRESGDGAFSVPLDVALQSPYVLWNEDNQRWSWIELLFKATRDDLRGVSDKANINRAEWYAVLQGSNPAKPYTMRYSGSYRKKRVKMQWHDFYHGRHILSTRNVRRLFKKQSTR